MPLNSHYYITNHTEPVLYDKEGEQSNSSRSTEEIENFIEDPESVITTVESTCDNTTDELENSDDDSTETNEDETSDTQ